MDDEQQSTLTRVVVEANQDKTFAVHYRVGDQLRGDQLDRVPHISVQRPTPTSDLLQDAVTGVGNSGRVSSDSDTGSSGGHEDYSSGCGWSGPSPTRGAKRRTATVHAVQSEYARITRLRTAELSKFPYPRPM
ncbi:hypothetical protein ACFWY6_30320 [Streptomyces sp. NPDC059037]|uniref:hypothetical protein n=1 Tax=Streptomyces sp. NPDC059037 TaxID=3346710 RepID=UPI0036B6203F